MDEQQKCRKCGCTDECACPGGCAWVLDNLCSACIPQHLATMKKAATRLRSRRRISQTRALDHVAEKRGFNGWAHYLRLAGDFGVGGV